MLHVLLFPAMAMIVPAKDAKFRWQKLNYFMISVRQLQLAARMMQMSIVVGSLQAVTGDKVILAASDRHWQPLKIRVSGLTVYFPEASSPQPRNK